MTAVLDDVLPVYRHRERHTTQIAATPEAVWSALHTVSAGDMRLTRVLMSIRALPGRLRGARRPPGGLPADRGFIEAFMERGFRELLAVPPRTLVAGNAGQPWRLRGGGIEVDVVDLDGFRAFARAGFVLSRRASSSRRSATAPGSAPRPACNPPTPPRPARSGHTGGRSAPAPG